MRNELSRYVEGLGHVHDKNTFLLLYIIQCYYVVRAVRRYINDEHNNYFNNNIYPTNILSR